MICFKRASLSWKILSVATAIFMAGAMLAGDLLRVRAVQGTVLPYMPPPTKVIGLTGPYDPLTFRGVTVHPDRPFTFDFIIDEGRERLNDVQLREETARLVRYFLAALTVPEEDLWVNLSPYESDRVIPEHLAVTDMGRDMLGEDYVLKQLAASLTHPDTPTGEAYWRVENGEAKIENRLDKIWIVPDKAVVYEDGSRAFVGEASLKVQCEDAAESLRELLPAVEREVNTGRYFYRVRQMYHALMLAAWFKRRLADHVITTQYADRNTIAGIDVAAPSIKRRIYEQYLTTIRKGVYDVLRAGVGLHDRSKGIRRRFFAGGLDLQMGKALSIKPFAQGRDALNWRDTSSALRNVRVELLPRYAASSGLGVDESTLTFRRSLLADRAEAVLRSRYSHVHEYAQALGYDPVELILEMCFSVQFAPSTDDAIEEFLPDSLEVSPYNRETIRGFLAGFLRDVDTANAASDRADPAVRELVGLLANMYAIDAYISTENGRQRYAKNILPANPVPGSAILDVATSTNIIYHLHSLPPGQKLIVYDLSLFTIRVVEAYCELTGQTNVKAVHADALTFERPMEKIGLVRFAHGEIHVPGFAKRLPEVAAWLEPGAQIRLEYQANYRRIDFIKNFSAACRALISEGWDIRCEVGKTPEAYGVSSVSDVIVLSRPFEKPDAEKINRAIERWNTYLKEAIRDLLFKDLFSDPEDAQALYMEGKMDYLPVPRAQLPSEKTARSSENVRTSPKVTPATGSSALESRERKEYVTLRRAANYWFRKRLPGFGGQSDDRLERMAFLQFLDEVCRIHMPGAVFDRGGTGGYDGHAFEMSGEEWEPSRRFYQDNATDNRTLNKGLSLMKTLYERYLPAFSGVTGGKNRLVFLYDVSNVPFRLVTNASGTQRYPGINLAYFVRGNPMPVPAVAQVLFRAANNSPAGRGQEALHDLLDYVSNALAMRLIPGHGGRRDAAYWRNVLKMSFAAIRGGDSFRRYRLDTLRALKAYLEGGVPQVEWVRDLPGPFLDILALSGITQVWNDQALDEAAGYIAGMITDPAKTVIVEIAAGYGVLSAGLRERLSGVRVVATDGFLNLDRSFDKSGAGRYDQDIVRARDVRRLTVKDVRNGLVRKTLGIAPDENVILVASHMDMSSTADEQGLLESEEADGILIINARDGLGRRQSGDRGGVSGVPERWSHMHIMPDQRAWKTVLTDEEYGMKVVVDRYRSRTSSALGGIRLDTEGLEMKKTGTGSSGIAMFRPDPSGSAIESMSFRIVGMKKEKHSRGGSR